MGPLSERVHIRERGVAAAHTRLYLKGCHCIAVVEGVEVAGTVTRACACAQVRSCTQFKISAVRRFC